MMWLGEKKYARKIDFRCVRKSTSGAHEYEQNFLVKTQHWSLKSIKIIYPIGFQTWMRQSYRQERTCTQGNRYQAIARKHCRIQAQLRDHGRCCTSFPQDQNHGQHSKVLLFDLLHRIPPWPKQGCQGWHHRRRQEGLRFGWWQRYTTVIP